MAARALARAAGAPGCRRIAKRASRGLVRAVEPDVRDDESCLGGREAASALRRVGRATLSSTGASVRIRNFRVYFIGQVISFAGTWMQRVGQAILTLEIGGSGTTLGLVLAVQMLPVLLFSVWTGPFVDRIAKRRILFVTQTVSAVSALGLAVLVSTGRAELWMVYASAALLGRANPSRNQASPNVGHSRAARR